MIGMHQVPGPNDTTRDIFIIRLGEGRVGTGKGVDREGYGYIQFGDVSDRRLKPGDLIEEGTFEDIDCILQFMTPESISRMIEGLEEIRKGMLGGELSLAD